MAASDKKTPFEKSKEFMANNWWLVWVAILLNIVITHFDNAETKSLAREAISNVKDLSRGVVFIGPMGSAAYGERQIIDATNESFKSAILNVLRFYSVKDWVTLSQNYTQKVKTVEELEAANKDIVEFKKNFFSDAEQSQADFLAYEKTLLHLANTDNLPDKIVPSSARITSFGVNNNEFTIDIAIDVAQSSFLAETNNWTNRTGTIEIRAVGTFDTSATNPINPLGIHFSAFKPTFLKKR